MNISKYIKKPSLTSLILFILIVNTYLMITNKQSIKKDIKSKLERLEPYIKKVELNNKGIVIFVGSGPILNDNGELTYDIDRITVNKIKEVLSKNDYSFITTKILCVHKECIDEYYDLAESINLLKPDAIIFRDIRSTIETQEFNKIVKSNNIPIYVFGTEIDLDYRLYTGPSNKGLGDSVVTYLEPYIKKGDKVLYVETVRLFNNDPFDNGYPRINNIREQLTSRGIIETGTIFTRWSKSSTYEETVKLLSEKGPVDYIIAPSFETFEGALQAIKYLGLVNTKIITLDFTPELIPYLKSGELYGCVSQELNKQGEVIGEAIINNTYKTNGNKVLHASKFITKDNINEFIDDKGDYIY